MKTYKKNALPFRMCKNQTAEVLGFKSHDIPILINAKLLKPLGKPVSNAPKYFCTVTVLKNGKDEEWMHKAEHARHKHWKKNHEKREG